MKALEALTGRSSPLRRRGRPPGSGSSSGNGRRRSARRAPRGQRRQQVLDVLKEQELGPSAIAREVGVNPTQISGLLRQLAAEGKVARTDAGKWRATPAAAVSGDSAAAAQAEAPGGGEGGPAS